MHRVRDTSGIALAAVGVICPSGGLLTGLSSPLCKNISLPWSVETGIEQIYPVPHRGAFRDRHERGVGCGGRGSVLRAMGSQGGSKDL
jgi:hypothetical protein